jgi:OmpA-OmpF porin, OOP family
VTGFVLKTNRTLYIARLPHSTQIAIQIGYITGSLIMTTLLIFITLITSIIFVPSLAAKPKGDKAGSKDHPLVQRYKGSRIVGYNYSDFDQYDLVVGVKERGKKTPTKALEGKITSIIYETADNKESLLKVFRNFEIAFKKAGLEKLYSCVNNDCGKRNAERSVWK